MIGGRARDAVAERQCRKIQLLDNLDHKTCEVILGQPVVDRGRQQEGRIAIDGTEVAYARTLVQQVTDPIPYYLEKFPATSDRLLGADDPGTLEW